MLNFLAHRAIYHPHPYASNYRQLLSAGVIELPFQTRAGRQTAFYIPSRKGSALPDRIWIAFCGNGSLALDWLPLTEREQKSGDAFLLIDYPGYGKSEGRPSAANTRSAAEGAVAALAVRLGTEPAKLEPRLNAIGHSLGAAAALDFASHHAQVHRIILAAPFTSVREVASLFIGSTLSHLLGANYDNRAALRQLAQRRPLPRVVIFHGLEDSMIPPAMGRALAAEFPEFVSFHGVPEADHDMVIDAAEDEILRSMSDDTKQGMTR